MTRCVLSCVGRECSFPKADVQGLSRHGGLFSTGLRIEHTVSSYPEFVVFWTFGFETLKRGLESTGTRFGKPLLAARGWVEMHSL